jgi:hypothetical protein
MVDKYQHFRGTFWLPLQLLILKMKAAGSSAVLLTVYQTA